ncbi:sialidase-1 [Bacillus oleivorans]|uniref:exo-alpha-sialidase n=1 Tax=Bacillus oleivorans TaxID=1448271 RepID=A0A285CSY6_9BACI|nr:sialidase family protein [Bacillus oleivorans]SNX70690.1 sialidase-1 [Bacillus oleivorans]
MLKRCLIPLLSAILVISLFAPASLAKDSKAVPEPIIRVENQQIKDGYYTNLNDRVEELKNLDEGTIIVRFRHTGSGYMSLFSLSNKNLPDGHFHLYVSPSSIGSENRFEKPGEPKTNTHISASIPIEKEKIYTVAMVVDQEKGYKFYVNGELVKEDTQSPRKFLSNIYQPNSSQLGRTERAGNRNQYLFSGDIVFAEIYAEPLADDYLIQITEETKAASLENPMPDNVYVTDPYPVFYPGFMDSSNYRIPALYYTKQGTLLAGIDKRVESGADSPNNIDAVVRRSFDQGDTWEAEGIVINDYPDQASNIDLSFLQDESTERIFALVDGFPHGAGLMGGFGTNAYKGTGFKTIDGKSFMYLLDSEQNEYTIREDGIVYDASGNITPYTVDQDRNLYENGVKINNIFSKTSPLKPFKTSYLELYYSDDEGKTWTGPIDLNPAVKEDWMIFLGVGPGNGIQIKEGPHAGRLVFPVYFLNEYNRQASAVIYSDDNGLTWHRSESPNEGRLVGNGETIDERYFTDYSLEITEAQAVEMPNGQLKLFMRNHSGYAQIATSFDGGETWDAEVITEQALVAPYSQMSAIRYNGQIDGKEAVIFSSANHPTSRINGTVRIGIINQDGNHDNGEPRYVFDWKYQQLVKEGTYGYSSLTNLDDGLIGLFYEGTANTVMDFIKFNTDYLKWERIREAPSPQLLSAKLEEKRPNVYRPGEQIRVTVQFDDYVMLIGNKQLHGTVNGGNIDFHLVEQIDHETFIFEGTIPQLLPRTYEIEVTLDPNLRIFNVYGKPFTDHETRKALLTENIHIAAPKPL